MSTLDDPRSARRTAAPGTGPRPAAGGFRAFTVRRPITALLLLVIPAGWAILGVPALAAHGVIPGGDLPVAGVAPARAPPRSPPCAGWGARRAGRSAGCRRWPPTA